MERSWTSMGGPCASAVAAGTPESAVKAMAAVATAQRLKLVCTLFSFADPCLVLGDSISVG
ncbi:hypothetical protein Misp02_66680 [Microtetraspora sp. NBRC 16547]|nr:hypothetical protein Misp02_66680 [Microtetraspora sp. NBRC 16547]